MDLTTASANVRASLLCLLRGDGTAFPATRAMALPAVAPRTSSER
jgi:hypothetical protein